MMSPQTLVLFPPWNVKDWRQVDDSVRGGSSKSFLDSYDTSNERTEGVYFHGLLDIKTLGGAGFASQKYDYHPPLNLSHSQFSGFRVHIDLERGAIQSGVQGSGTPEDTPCLFTLTITTTPAKKLPNGRTASRIVWEANFQAVASQNQSKEPHCLDKVLELDLAFCSFVPTYRGGPIEHSKSDEKTTEDVDLVHDLRFSTEHIHEIGLMCRSNFGKQEGKFGIHLLKIEAVKVAHACEEQTLWSRLWNLFQRWKACLVA